jgi:hypothetical protein
MADRLAPFRKQPMSDALDVAPNAGRPPGRERQHQRLHVI